MELWTSCPDPYLTFKGHPFLSCLFDNMHVYSFACFLSQFACQHVFFPLLACLDCLLSVLYACLSFFACLLVLCFSLFIACTHGAWVQILNASQKGNDQQIRRLSLFVGSSLSLSQNHVYNLLDQGSFSCTLLRPHFLGIAMPNLGVWVRMIMVIREIECGYLRLRAPMQATLS